MNAFKVPFSLRNLRQWVLWKFVTGEDGKQKKMPFQVNGEVAKADDRSTWGEFTSVFNRYSKGGYEGVGFEFSRDDEFCGVDLDGCRDPETGRVAEWAKEIILSLKTYAEVSPSKSGVKLFLRAKSPLEKGKKRKVDGEKIGDKEPAIEVYDWGRYFAVTGLKVNGPSEPEERQKQLAQLVKEFWPDEFETKKTDFYSSDAVIERARKYLVKLPPAVSGDRGHDKAFHAACVLVNGFGLSESDSLKLLSEWNQTCQPPWSDKELEHKVADASKQPGERNYLRNVKPQNWSGVRVPEYKSAPPKPEPRIITLQDATRNYIESLKNGKVQLIETGVPDIDYAIGGGVEPSEMVILAARPSHGKSAVALQSAHAWTLLGIPVLMISEEMSAFALGKRTLQFISDTPQEHWRTSITTLESDIAFYSEKRAQCIIAESCGTAESAIEQIDKAVDKHGVRCVIVDYAQLLRSPGKSRYEQVTTTSILLKQAAARHRIVLMMLCQLSREIESRTKYIPMMSDIKDTGQLEQDADVILFLVWPHRIDSSNPPEEFLCFVAKNRNRPINESCVKVRFLPSRQMVLPPRVQDRPNYEPAFDAFNRGEDF